MFLDLSNSRPQDQVSKTATLLIPSENCQIILLLLKYKGREKDRSNSAGGQFTGPRIQNVLAQLKKCKTF